MGVAASMLLVLTAASCRRGGDSEARAGRAREAPDTPQAAFASVKAAAAGADFAGFYDLCDEKGQHGLLEVSLSLATMAIYAGDPQRAKDTESIKSAFREELGITPEELEKADRDGTNRRDCYLRVVKKSPAIVRETLGKALADFAMPELMSTEMEGADVARLRLTATDGDRIWYMVRERGRWVFAGGLSPRKPESGEGK